MRNTSLKVLIEMLLKEVRHKVAEKLGFDDRGESMLFHFLEFLDCQDSEQGTQGDDF